MQSRDVTRTHATRSARAAWSVLGALLAAAGTVPREGVSAASAPSIHESDVSAEAVVQAWQTVRHMDCARCHGRDHDGLAAPSVLEFVRTTNRERFDRIVLDGNPGRGMPGYRQVPRVADNIDNIYLYFVLRAEGTVGTGQPFARPISQLNAPSDRR